MTEEIATNLPEASDEVELTQTDGVAEADEQDGSEVELDADGQPIEGQGQTQEDDTEEVEHEGQKFRVPKALKPALMMHADYTRKTQEVAEIRKAAESERARFMQTNSEQMQGMARLVAIDEQIEQYSKVDWQSFNAQDPAQAQAAWFHYSQLKDSRQQTLTKLQQVEQQRALEMQRDTAKRIEESRAVLARDIKGWTPQVENEVLQFAVKELGFSPKEIATAFNANIGKTFYYAMLGSQVLNKQQAATRKPPPAPAAPVPTVGGSKATATQKDPAKMTDAEFAAWRKRQIAQRR